MQKKISKGVFFLNYILDENSIWENRLYRSYYEQKKKKKIVERRLHKFRYYKNKPTPVSGNKDKERNDQNSVKSLILNA